MVELKHPDQTYIRCAGTLGWALPAAIGAKCALPDRPVVCFTGDGGLYYHISELETAARLGINLVTIVNNNGSLQQTREHWEAAFPQLDRARPMWVFHPTNLAQVAEGLGCPAIRVEHPAQIRPAIEMALERDRPLLIEVITDVEALPPPPSPREPLLREPPVSQRSSPVPG
jgi:acetolactate synthase-1/2/3 large subunit